MEISLRTNGTLAELTVKTNNTEIIESIADYSEAKMFHIDESIEENFVTVANDISRFNKKK